MDKKHTSVDFSDILVWYRKQCKELRDEAMKLEKKRKKAIRAREMHQKMIRRDQKLARQERRERREKILNRSHPMVRRSQVSQVMESDGVPEHVHSALRFHMSTVHGVSKCATCGTVKETKYFSYNHTKFGNLQNVSPSCIRCTAMAGYDKDPVMWFCKYAVSEAKTRAENNGIPFDLDKDWVYERFNKLKGCCELCDREMTVFKKDYREKKVSGSISFMNYPMNMSLDQRVPSLGYTKENVQLVNLQCNLAKLDLSQESFLEMCRGVVAKHGN